MTAHEDVNCGADDQANLLYVSLTADAPTPPTVDLTGEQFSFSADLDSDLYANIVAVTLAELTSGDTDGAGVFDVLMASIDGHIQREFKGNRLTGDQYANVYLNALTAVLDKSVEFLLNKDKARWEAITAQMNGRIAEIKATEALIELEKTKVLTQKAIFEMQNSGADYALTKMNLAKADKDYCLIGAKIESETFNRNWLMPADLAIKQFTRSDVMPTEVGISQIKRDRVLPATAALDEFKHREILPIEKETARFELDSILANQFAIAEFTLTKTMPIQFANEQHMLNFQNPAKTNLINEQKEAMRAQTLDNRSDGLTPVTGLLGQQQDLLEEQTEAERAKTLDTRTDATTVVGAIGKQKDLYTQQIDSFIKDAQHKTAKMWLDGWITQKTLDEALLAPDELKNDAVDDVLSHVRKNNSLDGAPA